MTSMDILGFEPKAFRMRSGCDATTPCALALIYKTVMRSTHQHSDDIQRFLINSIFYKSIVNI